MGIFSFLKKQKYANPSESIDDPIDFESMYTDINEIGIRGYKPTHITTCKKIWRDYVPDRGQSGLFDEDQKNKLALSLESIRNKGRYALSYQEGEISDDEANPLLCAYVDNDLYDYIADAIAIFAEANPEPIGREIDDSIYR